MENRNSQKKRTRQQTDRKTVIVLAVVFLCAIGVITGVQSMLHRTIDRYDPEIIIGGVSVGETDVSGMTAAEAEAAVEQTMQQYGAETVTLTLENGGQAQATLTELGLKAKNLERIIRDAVDYGKTGDPVDCYKILKKSEKNENHKTFPVEYEVTAEQVKTVAQERLAGQLKSPVNARLTQENGATVVVEDELGEAVDVEGTVANLNSLVGGEWDKKGGEVSVKLTDLTADITAETLSGITDVLGTYSTYYGDSSEGRTKNVESGANHIGGTLVEPGQEVSANDLMAPYTEENGYAMAPSYENGEVVDSMGGGICQVSTTLYNALIRAEVEIVERYAHSMLVSYVEPSMDAAIATDLKDLKFRNNKEEPVYIEAVLSDGNITFNIYGKETRPEGRTIEFVSETVEKIESDETRYVATNDSIGTMYTSSSGRSGLVAQLWKIVYENGEEVSRDTINYSQYRASGKTVSVGSASDNEAETEKMRTAVSTQDETKIKAAIQEILAAREAAETEPEESGGETSEESGGSGTENTEEEETGN